MHAHGLYAQELWLAMRSMPAAAAALAAVRRGVDPNTNPTLTPTPTLTLTLTPTRTLTPTPTLTQVRDDVDAAAGAEARGHLRRSREELTQTRVHRALTRASGRFRARDGPLPVSIDACAIVALVLCALVGEPINPCPHPSYHPLASPSLSSLAGALVGEPALRELLPLAAPLLLDAQEPLLADGCGSALAEDILCSRGHVAAELVRSGIA